MVSFNTRKCAVFVMIGLALGVVFKIGKTFHQNSMMGLLLSTSMKEKTLPQQQQQQQHQQQQQPQQQNQLLPQPHSCWMTEGGMNSQEWIRGPRWTNVQDGMDEHFVRQMILLLPTRSSSSRSHTKQRNNQTNHTLHPITNLDSLFRFHLNKTLCHSRSRLVQEIWNAKTTTKTTTTPTTMMMTRNSSATTAHHHDPSTPSTTTIEWDDTTIRLWAVRLVYLAFHYHQHHWAIPEAEYRIPTTTRNRNEPNQPCRGDHDFNNINNITATNETSNVVLPGLFDYECPGAKFMIVSLKPHGLGANVRTGIIPALLVALVTNRVAILVNNASVGNTDIRQPWPLASCERQDHQCFFLPLSPCVPTMAEIEGAHVFDDRVTFRRILKKQVWPHEYDHHKVWLFRHASGHTVQQPSLAVERLQNYSRIIVQAYAFAENDPHQMLLQQAIQAIAESDPPRPHVNYAMANQKLHHALAMYSLRPNVKSSTKLKEIARDMFPPSFDAEQAIGLPVRGSDKCNRESECLSFADHMRATTELWTRFLNVTEQNILNPTVVFTTESHSVLQEQKDFVERPTNLSYNFQFLLNTHDVTPDTGFIAHMHRTHPTIQADDAMLSSISSFQAQLMTRVTLGNCCSHYHHLLNDFLQEGCGAASDNAFMCLQESQDPTLRVCCAWHTNCIRKYKNRSGLRNWS